MRDSRFRLRRALFAALAILTGACASTGPEKFATADAMYARALEEVADEDWPNAILLLERLKLEHPSFARIQEARMQLGNAYFAREEYLTAATEFLRLATDYPTGPFSDDARFRVCEAYHELSPIVERDQQYTKGAIDHCQALINYYPNSEFVARAREIIAEMTNKLARKILHAGAIYQDSKAYDAAVLYFEMVLREYPNTPTAPEALYRLVEVYTRLGYTEEAQAARDRLTKDYPESPAAKRLAGNAAPGSE